VSKNHNAILPGGGIGPEVIAKARRVHNLENSTAV
jgi:isocitrate/isopropylmalate dehydrogenase